MLESHASSRDEFENSSPELDALVGCASKAPGFMGGKLSGAGWAGCTVNLAKAEQADDFAEAVESCYTSSTGTAPAVHVCKARRGAYAMILST